MFAVRCATFVACLIPLSVFAAGPKPHVVMLIAEREYQTDQTLPAFAKAALGDYRSTFVFADANDRNRLNGIESVESADVLVISVRRRTLATEQLDIVRRYVAAGKPLIGIRTASHAFSLRNQDPPQGRAVWPEFDREVFGGNYTNHFGNSLKATIRLTAPVSGQTERLLRGLERTRAFVAGGSLYRVSPLADGTTVLFVGRVQGESAQPVAWTYRRADGGKSFYTSLGHAEDFQGAVLPRLLSNAVAWGLEEQ